jgi:hypothetical protein
MVQWHVCCLILDNLLAGAKYSCISPRGGRGSSADIKDDTGNNLTNLYHQANSSAWQQTLIIHSNNNRGTETQQSTSDFDANGNLLTLNNIGTLDWHYNNTLNQLTKAIVGISLLIKF